MKPAQEICPTTTLKKVKEGALIVDVRNRDEVNELAFDVPNIINIPISELEQRIDEIPKDQEIVMVCTRGEKSLRTTYYLMNAGYEKVFNMRDGLIKWVNKGFPVKGNAEKFLETESCDCSKPNCC